MRKIDLLGQRFGRLTVVASAPSGGKHARWLCACLCGTRKVVYSSNLLRGLTQSCGCLNREISGGITKHAHSNSRNGSPSAEYVSWQSMKTRCENPSAANFKYYGGRGIMICARWRNSFEDFLADMGFRPSPQHSIDRIRVDGHYEPGNVRWATAKQQANNRRDPRHAIEERQIA
jgi:hypothetical protein